MTVLQLTAGLYDCRAEPTVGGGSRAEIVSGPRDQGSHVLISRGPQTGFHLDPDRALVRARMLECVLGHQRKGVGAEIVDIARKEYAGAGQPGGRDGVFEHGVLGSNPRNF